MNIRFLNFRNSANNSYEFEEFERLIGIDISGRNKKKISDEMEENN